MDVLTLTSIPQWEGMSNTLLEAMSSGVPVISTKSVGASEIIIDGVNGFLIEANNVSELSAKIEFLSREKMHLKELSYNSRKIILEQYALSTMINTYDATYAGILKKALADNLC
jgi:glycosyltransferase involved in cell wall biosynthesis